jgi:hypothetical protein
MPGNIYFFLKKMMKKSLAAIIIILASCTAISFGAGIGDVSLRFCNGSGMEKSLTMNLIGNQTGNICMQFSNSSAEAVPINISFVDGTITNDADQKKACKNEGDNQQFGKYVSGPTGTIIVPAQGTITQTGTIMFPKGF